MNLRTIIIFALLVCACILPLHAQVGEQRHNFAVGVNGGINLNSVSFSPSVKQKNLMGINGGVTARYISEKYFSMICGAQIELNFSQHGWDEYYEDYPTLSYTRTMNYVEIPFLAHLAFGKDRGLQFFIHAGPQIGFLLGDSEKIDGDWDGTVAESYTNITVEQHGKYEQQIRLRHCRRSRHRAAHQGRQFHRRRKILLCFVRFLWQHQEGLFLTLRTRSHYYQDNLSLRLEEVMLIGNTRFHT